MVSDMGSTGLALILLVDPRSLVYETEAVLAINGSSRGHGLLRR
jgi:hypothetical protein